MIEPDLEQRATLDRVMSHGWLADPHDDYQDVSSIKFSS